MAEQPLLVVAQVPVAQQVVEPELVGAELLLQVVEPEPVGAELLLPVVEPELVGAELLA